MKKIDLKDRKILYHLDINSRQSFSELGKKVGLHKDVVAYRVKRLQEKGIIYNFFTDIDITKLGYIRLRYYFVFQFASPEKRKEIIDYFMKSKYTLTVNSLEGQYDLSVYMAVKDIYDFYHFWEKAFSKYGKYFSKRSFSLFCYAKMYCYSFLIYEDSNERNDINNVWEIGGRSAVKIDDLDIKLLKLINTNARIPTIKLAENLKCTTQTIKSKIKNLIKQGVIKAYKIEVDISKLKYKLYRLDINLNEGVKKQPILDFLIKNPYVRTIYGTIGDAADIELEIYLTDVHHIHKFIESISLKFPDSIKDFKYHSNIKRHKMLTIPEK